MRNGKPEDQLMRLMDEHADGRALRVFVCSQINELFAVNIDLGGESWLKKLAVKIARDYPRIYRLLCTFRLNKVYSRLVRGQEQKNE